MKYRILKKDNKGIVIDENGNEYDFPEYEEAIEKLETEEIEIVEENVFVISDREFNWYAIPADDIELFNTMEINAYNNDEYSSFAERFNNRLIDGDPAEYIQRKIAVINESADEILVEKNNSEINITFSINRYDKDGDVINKGIYLHLNDLVNLRLKNLDSLSNLITQLQEIEKEIKENY